MDDQKYSRIHKTRKSRDLRCSEGGEGWHIAAGFFVGVQPAHRYCPGTVSFSCQRWLVRERTLHEVVAAPAMAADIADWPVQSYLGLFACLAWKSFGDYVPSRKEARWASGAAWDRCFVTALPCPWRNPIHK